MFDKPTIIASGDSISMRLCLANQISIAHIHIGPSKKPQPLRAGVTALCVADNGTLAPPGEDLT